MTNHQTKNRLDRIEAIHDAMASNQQKSQERHDAEMAAIRAGQDRSQVLQQENAAAIAGLRLSQQQSQARHDAEIAEIRALQRENATGIAELREAQQANLTAIAETRKQLQASIGDVVDMISQQSDVIKEERDQTIGVEVDTLNALGGLQEGQAGLRADVQNLNTYVRRGFDILGQALVELREEMQIGFGSMSELLQKLIDEVKVNSGRITRLEDM